MNIVMKCGNYEYPIYDGHRLMVEMDHSLGTALYGDESSNFGRDDLYDLGFRHEQLKEHGLTILVDSIPILHIKD